MLLVLVLAALLLGQRGGAAARSFFEQQQPSEGWAFQFVLRGNASRPQQLTALGSEYFAAAEQRVRRDWARGCPACPLPAEAAGSELLGLGALPSQHLLLLRQGEWSCQQSPLPAAAPRPAGPLRGTPGAQTRLVRGQLAAALLGAGLDRPGPACPEDPAGNWTAWLAEEDGALLQLDTACFELDVYNWQGPPVRQPGSQYGPLSVPLVCPVDLPPQPVGYALAAALIAALFFGLITIRK